MKARLSSLHRAQEEADDDDAGHPSGNLGVQDAVDDLEDDGRCREERRQHRPHRDQLEGDEAEREDALLRQRRFERRLLVERPNIRSGRR